MNVKLLSKYVSLPREHAWKGGVGVGKKAENRETGVGSLSLPPPPLSSASAHTCVRVCVVRASVRGVRACVYTRTRRDGLSNVYHCMELQKSKPVG